MVLVLSQVLSGAASIVLSPIKGGSIELYGNPFGAESFFFSGFGGATPFRGFWVFDLSSVSEPIGSAVIEVQATAVGTPSGTFSIWDFSRDEVVYSNHKPHPDYLDLGSGIMIGSMPVSKDKITEQRFEVPVQLFNTGSDLVIFGGRFDNDFRDLVNVASHSEASVWLVLNEVRKVPEQGHSFQLIAVSACLLIGCHETRLRVLKA